MRSRVALCLSFVASIAIAPIAGAQLSGITDGERVRINRRLFLPGIDGVLVSHTADTLVVQADYGRPHRVAVSSIERLERFEGRSYTAGAMQGLVAGMAIGVLLAANQSVTEHRSLGDGAGRVLGGAAAVGGLGALVGTFLGKEQWARISIRF